MPLISPELADRMRPWLLAAVTALLVCRPLFPSECVAAEGDGLPVVMLWLALTCLWLLSVLPLPELPLRFWLVDGALLLLVGIHSGVGVLAAMRAARRPAMNMLWEWIGMGLAFVLVRQLAAGRRECRALVAVMIAVAVGLSCFGLYQVAYDLPQTRAQYAADPDGALREAGQWCPPDSPERYAFEHRLASPEPITTFALTNSLAGFLVPWFIILASLGMTAWVERRSQPSWFKALGGCLLIGVCLALTRSRSAWAAAAVGLGVILFSHREALLGRGRRWLWAGAGLLAAVVMTLALVLAWDTSLLANAAKSMNYRLQYWQSTVQMILENPVAGCGPGNFQNAYTEYKLPEASEEVADPHNFLLEIWATAGTGAGLAALGLVGLSAYLLWPRSTAAMREEDLRHAILSDPTGWHGALDAPQSEIRRSSDRPGFVLAGAVVGFPLAWIIGSMGAAPQGPVILWLVMPTSLVALALLARWVYQGRMAASVPALGLLVLTIHLLTSGGIGFPGVALSLWLLLALSLNLSDKDHVAAFPRMAVITALGLTTVLLIVCLVTSYGPVLGARACLMKALEEPDRAEQWLQQAATTDPYSSRPLEALAALQLEAWRSTGDEHRLAKFEEYEKWALVVEPNSAPAWLASGDNYFEIYRKTHLKRDIDRAIRAYRTAVSAYPNSPRYRAKLALAYEAAGSQANFADEAAAALNLDAATPHEDKKLPDDLRRKLQEVVPP